MSVSLEEGGVNLFRNGRGLNTILHKNQIVSNYKSIQLQEAPLLYLSPVWGRGGEPASLIIEGFFFTVDTQFWGNPNEEKRTF